MKRWSRMAARIAALAIIASGVMWPLEGAAARKVGIPERGDPDVPSDGRSATPPKTIIVIVVIPVPGGSQFALSMKLPPTFVWRVAR